MSSRPEDRYGDRRRDARHPLIDRESNGNGNNSTSSSRRDGADDYKSSRKASRRDGADEEEHRDDRYSRDYDRGGSRYDRRSSDSHRADRYGSSNNNNINSSRHGGGGRYARDYSRDRRRDERSVERAHRRGQSRHSSDDEERVSDNNNYRCKYDEKYDAIDKEESARRRSSNSTSTRLRSEAERRVSAGASAVRSSRRATGADEASGESDYNHSGGNSTRVTTGVSGDASRHRSRLSRFETVDYEALIQQTAAGAEGAAVQSHQSSHAFPIDNSRSNYNEPHASHHADETHAMAGKDSTGKVDGIPPLPLSVPSFVMPETFASAALANTATTTTTPYHGGFIQPPSSIHTVAASAPAELTAAHPYSTSATDQRVGITNDSLLSFLQQQVQMHRQAQPTLAHTANACTNNEGNQMNYKTNAATDPNHIAQPLQQAAQPLHEQTRNLPSVEDFIPVVPRSLLNLVRTDHNNMSSNNNVRVGEGSLDAATGLPRVTMTETDSSGHATTTNSNKNNTAAYTEGTGEDAHVAHAAHHSSDEAMLGGGALVTLEAPKIMPQAEKNAREARRAHVSGFPRHTTTAELTNYFRILLSAVRKEMTQRAMDELAEQCLAERKKSASHNADAVDDDDEEAETERRVISPQAIVAVDEIRELTVNTSKSKPFAFIELNLADMITELVESGARDAERFIFTCDSDGCSYVITIRRPRDYEPMYGVDYHRVVMVGFPATLSPAKLRDTFGVFGTVTCCEVRQGLAYAEFEQTAAAQECRLELHGEALGQRMIVVLPLYDWLKVMCVQVGIDVQVAEDDPISGHALLRRVQSSYDHAQGVAGEVHRGVLTTRTAAGDSGDVHHGLHGQHATTATHTTHTSSAAVDVMRELLEMTVPIPHVITHLAATYSHLMPLHRNSHVPIYATRVLVLLNLFDEEELILDSAYSALVAAIESEVEQYGCVEELIVPRRRAKPRAPEMPIRPAARQSHTSLTQTNNNTTNSNSNSTQHEQKAILPRRGAEGGETCSATADDESRPRTDTTSEEAADEATAGEEAAYARALAEYEEAKLQFQRELNTYMERQIHVVWGGYGRVFVVYTTVEEAVWAQQNLVGRQFSGRTVVTSFMFEDVLYPERAKEEKEVEDKVEVVHEEGTTAKGGERECDADSEAEVTELKVDEEGGVEDLD